MLFFSILQENANNLLTNNFLVRLGIENGSRERLISITRAQERLTPIHMPLNVQIKGTADSGEQSKPSTECAKYPSDAVISESLARLDNTQTSSTERILQAKVQAEQVEAKRRDDEADDILRRNEIVKQIEEVEDDDTVAAGWIDCKETANAQDLCDLLKKQNAHCEKALSKLDDIRKQLGSQLRQKDHEYVTALKRNRLEIEKLQSCIEREHKMLKEAFERELELIQDSLKADKSNIVDERQNRLDALMAERNYVELNSLENQLKTIDQHRLDIKAAEASGDQDALSLKENLEMELRQLEIRLEDTKARHLFESDKLEFDVRVLDELSNNTAEIKKQKRRIMKGKEDLNRGIEAKHREQERGAKQNQILEDDCERIERQSNGLKEKFERFKISDNDKFHAILALHKDDLQQLQNELDKSKDLIFGEEIGC